MVMVMNLGSSEESCWSWVPKHLLDMILDKLVSFSDYVCFGAVCKPWHSVAMENKVQFLQNKCCRQVPFLMVPTEDNSDERRSLYSVTRDKLYDFWLRVPYKNRLSGSSHGWLFVVKEASGLTLMNPFSGATIEFPPIMDRSEFEPPEDEDNIGMEPGNGYEDTTPVEVEFEVIAYATLSVDPALSPNDYIVGAIYGVHRRLAFIQPGDKAWIYVDDEKCSSIQDVIYYKGQFFAVDHWSGIIMVDLNRRAGEMSKVPQVEVIAPRLGYQSRTYLVESSSGDLLLVQRYLKYIDFIRYETSAFMVFKMLLQQSENGSTKRVEVKSLGGDTLFLGDNRSICVSASKWPGCQPNSIYYTDDFIDILLSLSYGPHDIGIFNIENGSFGKNGSFGRHYNFDLKDMPHSIWIVPTILGNQVQK